MARDDVRPVVLEVDRAVREYKLGEQSVRAVDGMSLFVRKGEFVAIMGPSGSGKSTLLHLIGALDAPTAGAVRISGHDTRRLSSGELARLRNEHIGFVFQAFNLVSNLTAIENVELPMLIRETPAGERRARATELLRRMGLADRLHHKPAELSGGEKQRVSIARALANEPSFLLADEPTGNLDSKRSEEIMHFIYELWKEDRLTIVMVTHEPVVASHSERVIHLKDGKVDRVLSKREFSRLFAHEEFKIK